MLNSFFPNCNTSLPSFDRVQKYTKDRNKGKIIELLEKKAPILAELQSIRNHADAIRNAQSDTNAALSPSRK